uniref:Small ribosomal subunit protein uS15c n=1 Tax=Monsonia vanderietiae TaxID=28970 RepID=B7T420_MONVN|nr:ribosomal protein S15 [Monsonia vanderietiae]
MGKTPLISAISQEKKNTGSIEFQLFSLDNKIQRISSHLKFHKNDYCARRCLQKLLANRERLRYYLVEKKRKKNQVSRGDFIGGLNIQESPTSIQESPTSIQESPTSIQESTTSIRESRTS